jgi:hypothetical protein
MNSDSEQCWELILLKIDGKNHWCITSIASSNFISFDRIQFFECDGVWKTLLLGYKAALDFGNSWTTRNGTHTLQVPGESQDILEFPLPVCLISKTPEVTKGIFQSYFESGRLGLGFIVDIGGRRSDQLYQWVNPNRKETVKAECSGSSTWNSTSSVFMIDDKDN